jgi:hypothetical protein
MTGVLTMSSPSIHAPHCAAWMSYVERGVGFIPAGFRQALKRRAPG